MAYTRNRNGNRRNGRQEEKARPIDSYTANSNGSRIEVNIWQSVVKFGDDDVVVYNTTIKRSYCDDNDEWKDTTTMREQDLLVVARLLTRAYDSICNIKSKQ